MYNLSLKLFLQTAPIYTNMACIDRMSPHSAVYKADPTGGYFVYEKLTTCSLPSRSEHLGCTLLSNLYVFKLFVKLLKTTGGYQRTVFNVVTNLCCAVTVYCLILQVRSFHILDLEMVLVY